MNITNNVQTQLESALLAHQQGSLPDAIFLYQKVLEKEPDNIDALHLLGVAYFQAGQAPSALPFLEKAIALHPQFVSALLHQGIVLENLHRSSDALISYDRALAIEANHVQVLFNRANTLCALKRFEEAVNNYNAALTITPRDAGILFNRGNALRELHQQKETITNRSITLLEEALIDYQNVLNIEPSHFGALLNCGLLLERLKRLEDALIYFDKVLAIDPDHPFLFGNYIHLEMQLCRWENLQLHTEQLLKKIDQNKKVCIPFPMVAISDTPTYHKKIAEIFVKEQFSPPPVLPPLIRPYQHTKIRIGYFSADFYNHATAFLMTELFEQYDAATFEIFAFSFSPPREDAMVMRLKKSFTQFIDVRLLSDQEIAELARALEIDIAIDLKGFTNNSRPLVFALRAAPLQVNFLGFPGTMGAPWMDYLIADHTIIPTTHQHYYTEKIIYLPNTYQPNDTKRKIADDTPTKAALNLPETGFIFCCFNNNFKLTPAMFDSWARILTAVPNSVLWLLEDRQTVSNNLHQEIEARGIAPHRIIFAKRLELAEHLARHRQADLFLDTLPCNAHTTASDALWAGLPVLTQIGDSFSGRVAASLLNAIGLPELITHSQQEYEHLAITLAKNPEQLSTIKQKLNAHKNTHPLFDIKLFTKHIESAYKTIINHHQQNLLCDHIVIDA